MKYLDGEVFGLNKRQKIRVLGENKLGFEKLIKSRIIRKDAEKIIETIATIRMKNPQYQVSLICTKNICSKSLKLLAENNIPVIYEDLD